MSIILPDTLLLPEKLTDEFTSKTDYYKILNLDISSFIDKIFLNSFINNGKCMFFHYIIKCSFLFLGKVTLLSINTRIDCDNSVAISPKGELILNLDKDTYQSLGIDGKISHFFAKLKNRYSKCKNTLYMYFNIFIYQIFSCNC